MQTTIGNSTRVYKIGSTLVGLVFLAVAILVPSRTLIESLRQVPADLSAQLILGATIFRICLAILGLAVIALGVTYSRWGGVPREKDNLPRQSRWILAGLLFVLLAATALRFYRLNSGLWFDEIMTYVHYAQMPAGELISTYDSENNHILFSLLAHESFAIFGKSAWSLRLPAVLFGIASIWALYLLGRELSNPQEGLLAAALMAFSYHHLWFSQNARGYSGLLFWTILSSWLLIRGLRERRPQVWLLYAITAALGVFTHLTMVFVIIGQFCVYLTALFVRRKEAWPDRWVGLLFGFTFAGFLTLTLHAFVLPQMFGTIGGSETSVVAAWKNPIWTALEILRGLEIGFSGAAVAVIALAVFAAGFVSYLRKDLALLELLVIPPIVGAAAVIAVGHHLWPRFFFFALGFGVLVVVRGVMVIGDLAARLVRLPSPRSVWLGSALCLGMIMVSAASMFFAYGPKQDYTGALDYVKKNAQPGDAIVTAGLASDVYGQFYRTGWESVDTPQALNTIRSQAKRTWLIYTFPPVLQSMYPDVMTSIQSEFVLVQSFHGTVGDGTIFVCRSDQPPARTSTSRVGP